MVKKRKSNKPKSLVRKKTINRQSGVEFKGFTKTGKGIFVINGKTYHTSFGATVHWARAKGEIKTENYYSYNYYLTEEGEIRIIKRGTTKFQREQAKRFKENFIKAIRENYNQLVPQLAGNLFHLYRDKGLFEHFENLVNKIPVYKLTQITNAYYTTIDEIMKYYHNPTMFDISSLNDDFYRIIREMEKATNTEPFDFGL